MRRSRGTKIRAQRHLSNSQTPSPPAPLSTSPSSSFLAQFITSATLVSLTINRKWGDLSQPQIGHCERRGQLSASAGTQCALFFLSRSGKHIFRRGLFTEPTASRFGASLAEKEKNNGRTEISFPPSKQKKNIAAYCSRD